MSKPVPTCCAHGTDHEYGSEAAHMCVDGGPPIARIAPKLPKHVSATATR
jgi:hypothetical protein